MSIGITPVGGMGEVGKNMTVISFGEEKVIVDMGVKLENVLSMGRSIGGISREKLRKAGGIPDDTQINSQDISAIILTHGHLDHIGAVSKLANEYDAPIYASPFTAELVKRAIQEDREFEVDNEIKKMDLGDVAEIGDLEAEFIGAPHSIPHNTFPALHSSEGVVLCVAGFKVDDSPVLGPSTDYSSLSSLKNEGPVISLICSVKADEPEPTPPESHARDMLEEVMAEASDRGGGLLVTAFSSHIARIKEIVEISYEVDRRPIILGRSLRAKSKIASDLDLVEFPPDFKILGHVNSVRKALEVINEYREDYVVITTGHQGEKNALLSRIADQKEPYKIKPGDEIIFSASVIPSPLNKANRELLEAKLLAQGARLHTDVHVSGHAGKPGTKEFIEKVRPDHLIPFHGTFEKMKSVVKIGRKVGLSEEQLHMLENGQTLKLGG